MTAKPDVRRRCEWADSDPLLQAYHDQEWGVPVYDDRTLFEFLVLEGAQAGLSWLTILRRREAYRLVFREFDPAKVAVFKEADVRRALDTAGIIRNRRKVESAVRNARALLDVAGAFGSFAAYSWRLVGGRPRRNRWRTLAQIPAQTPESQAFSRDLVRRGFSFVGPTICYAHMQAVGMVNDHLVSCFRYRELERQASSVR